MVLPVGTIIAYAGDPNSQAEQLAAEGWLVCDGRAVLRQVYQQLYRVIGTYHGGGDGTTTFNLPDYRGFFLRGVDSGAGRDREADQRMPAQSGGASGDHVGSIQPFRTAMPQEAPFATSRSGDHIHTIYHVPNANSSYRIAGSSLSRWTDDAAQTTTDGAHVHPVTGGDIETRPTNAYVYYLIRYQ